MKPSESNIYGRSIFAVELDSILHKHKLDLTDLARKPLVFSQKTVQRLVESLTHQKPLPALNQIEIMALVRHLDLTQEEYLRIYAALLALGVQRLMLDYLPPERAWQIADEVRRAILDAEKQNPTLSIDFITRHARPLSLTPQMEIMTDADTQILTDHSVQSQSIESDPLEEALEYYDEGVRLFALGSQINVEDAQLMYSQTQIQLKRALRLLESLPLSIRESEDWQYWHGEALKQMEAVEEELI